MMIPKAPEEADMGFLSEREICRQRSLADPDECEAFDNPVRDFALLAAFRKPGVDIIAELAIRRGAHQPWSAGLRGAQE